MDHSHQLLSLLNSFFVEYKRNLFIPQFIVKANFFAKDFGPNHSYNGVSIQILVNLIQTCKSAGIFKSDQIWEYVLTELTHFRKNHHCNRYYRMFCQRFDIKHQKATNRRKVREQKLGLQKKNYGVFLTCCKCKVALTTNSKPTKVCYVWIFDGCISFHAPKNEKPHKQKLRYHFAECLRLYPSIAKLEITNHFPNPKKEQPAKQICIDCLGKALEKKPRSISQETFILDLWQTTTSSL